MSEPNLPNGNQVTQNSPEPESRLASPLTWIATFVDKYFLKMPQSVQVGVFIVFVLVLVIGWIRIIAPELWDSMLSRDIQIEGVLTRPNYAGVLDTTGGYFLSGTKLYVTKDHPNPNTPRFYFSWILKTDRREKNIPIFFSLMEGQFEKGMFITTPRELLQHRQDGCVRLEFSDIEMTGRAKIGFSPGSAASYIAGACVLPGGLPMFQDLGVPRKVHISPDSAGVLLRRIIKPEYTSARLDIREMLLSGGTSTMRIVADSLRSALLDGRTSSAGVYALVLSEFDSLSLFSVSPSYSSVFAEPFYKKAAELIRVGSESESNYMAALLFKLQDARCLTHVFDEFRQSDSESAKELCLYVIGGFSRNSSKELKDHIKSQLRLLDSNGLSADTRAALRRTITKFEPRTK